MARSPAVLALCAMLATGCADDSRPAVASSPTPAAEVPAAGPAPAPPSDPWADPIALATGISSTHYVPVMVAGEPYRVEDPSDGAWLELTGPDLIEDESGTPRAYRIGDTTGHALAAAKTTEGEPVVLDYALEWRAGTATLDGNEGAFHVTAMTLHKRGDGPARSTFTAAGNRWVRTPHP